MLDYEERHEPLFNLDLKRTETAIRSGRLDEAFNLLQAANLNKALDMGRGKAFTEANPNNNPLSNAIGNKIKKSMAVKRSPFFRASRNWFVACTAAPNIAIASAIRYLMFSGFLNIFIAAH